MKQHESEKFSDWSDIDKAGWIKQAITSQVEDLNETLQLAAKHGFVVQFQIGEPGCTLKSLTVAKVL
jgi:hypothetical protein